MPTKCSGFITMLLSLFFIQMINVVTSLCVKQTASSATTITLQTVTNHQYMVFNAINCFVTNGFAPTLTLSHYAASFNAKSWVYSFDAWTSEGSSSIILRYHDGTTSTDVAECASCYPQQSNITMWISWRNQTELSLGFGYNIGQNIAISTNYSKYYDQLSIKYISIWARVGQCSYVFYDDCDINTSPPTAAPTDINGIQTTIKEDDAETLINEGVDIWIYIMIGVILGVLGIIIGFVLWQITKKKKENTAKTPAPINDEENTETDDGDDVQEGLMQNKSASITIEDGEETRYIQ